MPTTRHASVVGTGNLRLPTDISGAMHNASDVDLWRRAAGGERDAFGELFNRHVKAVSTFCFRRTANWALAEDMTSAVFLQAWRRRSEVRMSNDSVLPWLYGVATNLLRNIARSDHRRDAAVSRVAPAAVGPDFADDLAERLDDQRRMRETLATVELLSRPEQDVLALCVWQGLSYEQAAVALGVPVGTVRSRLSRARDHLRELLALGG